MRTKSSYLGFYPMTRLEKKNKNRSKVIAPAIFARIFWSCILWKKDRNGIFFAFLPNHSPKTLIFSSKETWHGFSRLSRCKLERERLLLKIAQAGKQSDLPWVLMFWFRFFLYTWLQMFWLTNKLISINSIKANSISVALEPQNKRDCWHLLLRQKDRVSKLASLFFSSPFFLADISLSLMFVSHCPKGCICQFK